MWKANLAKLYAWKHHRGQYRKSSGKPYIVHPGRVAKQLLDYGIQDQDYIAIAWLHDAIEDTDLDYHKINSTFGKKVADGVQILTRDISREEYKKRLGKSHPILILIKIFDTIDNLKTLDEISFKGRMNKIKDCLEFYIPLSESIDPLISSRMYNLIKQYC